MAGEKFGSTVAEYDWKAGESASHKLIENLQHLGFETDQLKTGTPARERDHHKPCKGVCQSRSLTATHPVKRFLRRSLQKRIFSITGR